MSNVTRKKKFDNLDDIKPESLSETTRKARIRKNRTIILAKTYEETDLENKEKIALDLILCGAYLVFGENRATGKTALVKGMFCKRRLCPMCAWRRSTRIWRLIKCVIAEPEFAGKQFIFLTLTIRNCKPAELPATLDQLFKAWNSLTKDKRQPFRRSFAGTFRSLEVTYHDKKLLPDGTPDPFFDTYHPHFHVLAAVEPAYFSPGNPLYIGHDRLMRLWRGALGVDYDPTVHIEAIHTADDNAIAETAKYTVKAADYIDNPAVVEVLTPALHRRRLVAPGGLIKTVARRLKIEWESDGDDTSQPVAADDLTGDPIIQHLLSWQFGAHCYTITAYNPNDPNVFDPFKRDLVKRKTLKDRLLQIAEAKKC